MRMCETAMVLAPATATPAESPGHPS